jgi:hypothetical protein
MSKVIIHRKGYTDDIVYDEKDHPSLCVSVKEGCLFLSDANSILEIIPVTDLVRYFKR